MSEPTTDAPVLIAGAGPVGMTTALALHARGVESTILERDPEDRDRSGSRAIYVHGSTLRTLERIHPGLGTDLVDEGLVWPTRHTRWRGKQVFRRTYDSPGGSGDIPHFTSLPQVVTEEYMHEAVAEAGIDIHWEAEVDTVDSSSDGVTVETTDGREWNGEYLVGADGGGSQVRNEIGANFEGDQSENSFIIADIEDPDEDPLPLERLFHYDAPETDGRNVLLVPFEGGWRLDIQCFEDDDPEALTEDGRMREFVRDVMGEAYVDHITWVSTYKFLQVMADSFVDEHRRVLLAGEAAHLLAPFGARGMNSGIADADEAASAIAVAVDARTDAVARDEVELYAARREKAAEFNLNAAGQALEYLQGDDPVTVLRKEAAASLADHFESAGEWLDDAPYGPHGTPPIVSTGNY
ncbi:3-(3-hydroxy-phenyl)propionate hydroxylase [Halopenitus malekzadehii]|uniref:3-(3-hydroxy-phenyl)propionate hydroxylase n=1 Tax=Halopenitus malekzadehii TaxID=1267564 RepID=A0A1H6I3H1_9EURY|nr:FAD-dependent monooxygenase [Halopenitus malekzadehii]SEH42653.1 3-(3-hydroxy-phenyl)propionate hydroxylase [Halopenitus malekzadehii]